jgi:hypothetical protein
VAAVAADLNTEIEGEPANIRAVATWLRGGLGTGLGTLGDAVSAQRGAASGDWQGEAGTAFASRSQTLVEVADGSQGAAAKAADSVGVLASALDRAQSDMAAVRGKAGAAGLSVDGMWVRNPGSGPPSAGPSPAPDAPAADRTSWEQADQAVREHNAKVEVWNGCVNDANDANDAWQKALEAAAQDWHANDSTLIGLTGQLLGASVQIELIRRATPVLTADVDEMLHRASQLRQHAAALVDDAGRVVDPARYYQLLDEASDLEHGHPSARAGLGNWELPKGLTRGLWAIDVATAGFGIYSDIEDGESTAQAVTSNVVPAAASILAGTASGAAIGGAVGTFIPIPGVGTAAGVVVGAAVGTVVGAFTSGAIDSLWESGADSLGDWGNAAVDGVEEIGDTFSAAGDFAGDVVGSIF